MSIDSSLKIKNSLSGTRSVMTRAERVKQMIDEKRLDPKKDNALGLPKTKIKE